MKNRKKDEYGALRHHFEEICSWIDEHGREPNPEESRDQVERHCGIMLQTLRRTGDDEGWFDVLRPFDRHGLLPHGTTVDSAPAGPVQ
ncbi:MAG: hypothetical protein K6E40_00045 [Desulfovibrio sp.]|nr:hypothetical protein [Desulfovibrio sp.]